MKKKLCVTSSRFIHYSFHACQYTCYNVFSFPHSSDKPKEHVSGASLSAGPCSKEYLDAKAAEEIYGELNAGGYLIYIPVDLHYFNECIYIHCFNCITLSDVVFDVEDREQNELPTALKTYGDDVGYEYL